MGKRAVERYWLLYTLLWGGAAAAVMMTGLAERWGDVELMIFGATLGAGAVLPPALFPRDAEERARPIHERTATKLGLSVVMFAFLMNYFTTPFFYDVLHMHYGFRVRWTIRQNPIFLYLLTVAYFATYCALLLAVARWSRRIGARLPRPLAWLPVALAPFAVAALETALNANPFMTRLFCYDSAPFALSFGTLSYGACFCFTLPVWWSIDERAEGSRTPIGRVVVWSSAAMFGMVVVFELLRAHVAPHLTVVHEGARGLETDPTGTCLAR
ncbi:MAG: hypothetical protein U0414_29690 [Polyangiaceae bacterium]